MHHRFTLTNELIPIKAGDAPRQTPPQMRGTTAKELSNDPAVKVQLRLIEKLAEKNILDSMDLVYIFGGETRDTLDRSNDSRTSSSSN